jgi:hypothetical protein
MRFIKDILTEDKLDNKFSSKKTAGLLAFILAAVAFLVDGFNFYTINVHMFDSMLIFAATMLGLSVTRQFSGKSSKKIDENAD